MKKTFFLAALISLGFLSTSYAQTPKFVALPNGGMVPCDHPLAINSGLGCTNSDARISTVPTYECDSPLNPYAEPDRAAFCSARLVSVPTLNTNDYKIGAKYAHAYASNRMVVIGVTRDIYNRMVITYQWYAGMYINDVNSFIVGVNEQPWTKIED